MRKSRFSGEQMDAMLRKAASTSVAEAAKKQKVSEQTLYVWRKHFAGLAPTDVKRRESLELENAKLKRLLVERDLEVDLMLEVNRRNWSAHGGVATKSTSFGSADCRNDVPVGCSAFPARP